jgi:SAM-dependent methyltransferase
MRRLLRAVWYRLFRYHPYHYLGALLWAARGEPERQSFIEEFVKPLPKVTLRQQCLRQYWTDRYFAGNVDLPATPAPLRQAWGAGGATEYHRHHYDYFTQHRDEFDHFMAPLLNRVGEFLARTEFNTVVEVGCGHGLLLERVAAQVNHSSAEFVGLDLDAGIIAVNRQRYAPSRVRYHQADRLQDFLGALGARSVLVFANATFTYFTEKELLNCFTWLVTRVPRGAVVLADATVLDPQSEQHSRPYGALTFSHNYAFLLDQAGMKEIRCDLQPSSSPGVRKVLASATWGEA